MYLFRTYYALCTVLSTVLCTVLCIMRNNTFINMTVLKKKYSSRNHEMKYVHRLNKLSCQHWWWSEEVIFLRRISKVVSYWMVRNVVTIHSFFMHLTTLHLRSSRNIVILYVLYNYYDFLILNNSNMAPEWLRWPKMIFRNSFKDSLFFYSRPVLKGFSCTATVYFYCI